nr:hypothetical protein [Aeromicrobium sp.]
MPELIPGAPWGAAMQHVGIGVYSWSPISGELSWDDRLAAVFAADRPGEAPFDTWLRRVHPDDRAAVLATIAQFPEGERPERVFRIVLGDGRVRHMLVFPIDVQRDEDGKPVRTRGVMIDVTSARETEGRIAGMLDAISDGFFLLDHDYRFAFVNRQAELVFGATREELIGRSVWEAFPETLGSRFEDVYRRVMDDKVTDRFEEFYPEPLNGWFEVRAEPAAEGIVVFFQDVTERRTRQEERDRLLDAERHSRHETERARDQLAYEATHDPLTGLVNRWQFHRLAEAAIAELGTPVVVMFLDLDRFKLINDSLGHAVGDELLVVVGERLSRHLRAGDVLARQGGDEFVVLLRNASRAEALAVAERMRAVVAEPVEVEGHTLMTTVSIGLAAAGPGATVETMLRDADVALYRAKDTGRDSVAWFDAQSHQRLLDRIALESDLRDALVGGELEVHYQPSFAIDDGRLCGVEALARWSHPERGLVPPDVFIPLAEEAGLIRTLGRQVLEASCRQAADWQGVPDLIVWVNVSGRELTPGYADSVLDLLAQEKLSPHQIGIEVTESVLADEAVAVHQLRLLHTAGVAVAIDDFGTGYSSLARLAVLPISLLKIDRSFVSNVATPFGRAAVDLVVHLAGALGVPVIAEGVETPDQLEALREAGVGLVCGYLLGRPAAAQSLGPQILPT